MMTSTPTMIGDIGIEALIRLANLECPIDRAILSDALEESGRTDEAAMCRDWKDKRPLVRSVLRNELRLWRLRRIDIQPLQWWSSKGHMVNRARVTAHLAVITSEVDWPGTTVVRSADMPTGGVWATVQAAAAIIREFYDASLEHGAMIGGGGECLESWASRRGLWLDVRDSVRVRRRKDLY
jgi:hypothetical protein